MMVSVRTPKAWLARSGAAVVLSLQSLKDEMKDRWEAMRTPTGANLERLLRAKLGPSDRFASIDDLHWLVMMPDTGIEDALSCCLRIAHQLHTRMMPVHDLRQLKIFQAEAIADDVLELTPLSDDLMRVVAPRAGLDELLAAGPPSDMPEWHRFEPVWNANHQVITSYRALPESADLTQETVSQQLKCTQAMLGGTARLLERLSEPRMVFVPIPYDVLSAPPARMELLHTCRQMKCDLRPFLVFEIMTLAAGTPKHRLAEMVSAIQPFARAVIARAAPRNRSLLDYGGTGLKALGVDLGSQPEQIEIAGLTQAGKRLGLKTYLGNVVYPGTLENAMAKGVQWISGPIIGEMVSEPAAPSPLPLESILEASEPATLVGQVG